MKNEKCCFCGEDLTSENVTKVNFGPVFHGLSADMETMYCCMECDEKVIKPAVGYLKEKFEKTFEWRYPHCKRRKK